jgi:hypothetical protein
VSRLTCQILETNLSLNKAVIRLMVQNTRRGDQNMDLDHTPVPARSLFVMPVSRATFASNDRDLLPPVCMGPDVSDSQQEKQQ